MGKAKPSRGRRGLTAKQAVMRVVRRLRKEGYQALLAGGCVRDMLLGLNPHDYDVATDASPEEVTGLFRRSLTVGARFGVVVVREGGRQIEVATFRSDQAYVDGRRPEKVVFTDARQDAERRDFTINGMFYDPLSQEVVDYVEGQADLKHGVIRAIGDVNARFAEDHLRMLRAIRFAGRYEFEIEGDTWEAIRANAAKIRRISVERITGELERILTDPHRGRGMTLARDCGLLGAIFDSLDEGQLSLGIRVLGHLPVRCSFALSLAALLSGSGGKRAESVCRQLKTSNELRQEVGWLVSRYQPLLEGIPWSRGRLKKWLAEPLYALLVELCRCYLQGTGQSTRPLQILRQQVKELGDEPISPPRLLDGHQLIELGATPGPMVGQLAEELYLGQLENDVRSRAEAEKWVCQWLARHREREGNM